MPTLELVSRLITFVVCAILGYFLSRRLEVPKSAGAWVTWLIILVLSGYVGVHARLIDFFGAALYFNVFVQALTLGMVAGFVIRQSSSDRRT